MAVALESKIWIYNGKEPSWSSNTAPRLLRRDKMYELFIEKRKQQDIPSKNLF